MAKKEMKTRILFILVIFLFGCATSSKIKTEITTSDCNEDIFILSTLIQNHLQKTNTRDLTLNEIIQYDSLKRISNNFDSIKLDLRPGYIAVYYSFSKSREKEKSYLTDIEKDMIDDLKWVIKRTENQYNGKILFDYGERFYRIKKIIIMK